MRDPVETFEHKGVTVEIHYDDDPINPRREYDNVGEMICFHNRYDLGDKHSFKDPEQFLLSLIDEDEYEAWCDALPVPLTDDDRRVNFRKARAELMGRVENAVAVIMPLYLYDHSGLTISTGSFSCPWDSGQVGWIYCTEEQVQKEWGGDVDKAREYLEGEVETYDQYLTGQIYGYVVEDESCWGYFDLDSCKGDAQSAAEHIAKKKNEKLAREIEAERPDMYAP